MLFFSEYGDLMYSDGENTFLIDDYCNNDDFALLGDAGVAGLRSDGRSKNRDMPSQPFRAPQTMDGNGKKSALLPRGGR